MQEWQTFSKKGQTVNISGFKGHMISVAATQFSLLLAQKQPEPTVSKECGHVPTKLQSGLQVALVG